MKIYFPAGENLFSPKRRVFSYLYITKTLKTAFPFVLSKK